MSKIQNVAFFGPKWESSEKRLLDGWWAKSKVWVVPVQDSEGLFRSKMRIVWEASRWLASKIQNVSCPGTSGKSSHSDRFSNRVIHAMSPVRKAFFCPKWESSARGFSGDVAWWAKSKCTPICVPTTWKIVPVAHVDLVASSWGGARESMIQLFIHESYSILIKVSSSLDVDYWKKVS